MTSVRCEKKKQEPHKTLHSLLHTTHPTNQKNGEMSNLRIGKISTPFSHEVQTSQGQGGVGWMEPKVFVRDV